MFVPMYIQNLKAKIIFRNSYFICGFFVLLVDTDQRPTRTDPVPYWHQPPYTIRLFGLSKAELMFLCVCASLALPHRYALMVFLRSPINVYRKKKQKEFFSLLVWTCEFLAGFLMPSIPKSKHSISVAICMWRTPY